MITSLIEAIFRTIDADTRDVCNSMFKFLILDF